MTMGFRRSDLQEAFFVPGDRGFRVWGFSTNDSLADVLRPAISARAACSAWAS
jgi:hypothetical protein